MPDALDKFARGFLAFLVGQGFEVHVISSPGPPLEDLATREGVHAAHAVPMKRFPSPLADLKALRHLVHLFRQERYTIVHASTAKAGLLGMIAAWVARVPVRVFTYRGARLDSVRGIRWPVLWASDWLTMHLAHEVVAVGPGLRQRVYDLRLLRRKTVHVMAAGSSNGVDFQYFTRTCDADEAAARKELEIPAHSVVVGYVGRLAVDKGLRELADAWQMIRELQPESHLLVVGGLVNDEEDVAKDAVSGWERDSRVTMVGMVADPRPYYEAVDILVLPTYREGVNNVLLEAAAMELPVVASDIYGCRDAVIAGETALLVPVGSAAELAEAVIRLVEDRSLRRQLGTSGREHVVTSFRSEPIWEGLANLYQARLSRLTARRGVR
jgi:glycosyltransferase involved in cell wall biosynthesis